MKNDLKRFLQLLDYIEEISNKYISKTISIKYQDKIEIQNLEVFFFKKFRPHNINIETFSDSPKTTDDDIICLIKNISEYNIDYIDFSTFDLNKIIKF